MAWTAPRTWVAAETVTAALLNTHVRDNLKAIGDPWTSYTPTWTSSGTAPALGNGTIVGQYIQAGKLVHFRMKLTLGSTSTAGTGTYFFGLPVAAIAVQDDVLAVNGAAQNTGTAFVPTWCRRGTSSTVFDMIHLPALGAGAQVTATAPFAPGSTDVYMAAGSYEAA